MQSFFEVNQSWILPILGMLLSSLVAPLLRKLPPSTWWFIVLRAVVGGIFDMIQPANFARHADNAKNALADKKAGKPVSIETLRDQGDVIANLDANEEITKP